VLSLASARVLAATFTDLTNTPPVAAARLGSNPGDTGYLAVDSQRVGHVTAVKIEAGSTALVQLPTPRLSTIT